MVNLCPLVRENGATARRILVAAFCLSGIVAPLYAQTTYYLHAESSSTPLLLQLKTVAPDVPPVSSVAFQTGRGGSDRNSGGQCKNIPGTECQIKKLIGGMDAAVASGTCPSCGQNYKRFIIPDLTTIDGFNSNTWVYNMILGAGMTPPSMGRAPGYHQAAGAWYPQ